MGSERILMFAIFLIFTYSCYAGTIQRPRSGTLFQRNSQPRNLQPPVINSSVGTLKRSWKCVVLDLARINNLNSQDVEFRFQGEVGPVQNHTFRYRLNLGREHYDGSSSSKKKAQDIVAKEAFEKTSYKKPILSPQLCVIKYSVLSELQEWASKQKMSLVFYVAAETDDIPKEYIYECLLNGTIHAQGKSTRKKEAKALAAREMVAKLRGMNFSTNSNLSNLGKYNTSEATQMHPVARLYEIQMARREMEPIFSTDTMIEEFEHGRKITHYIVSVKVDNMKQSVSAGSIRKARELAARNMLSQMGYRV